MAFSFGASSPAKVGAFTSSTQEPSSGFSMKANKTAAPAKTANPASLTDGIEGVVSFPSRGFASFRFEIVAKNEKLHIWLEDRKTKKQWQTAQLAIADFVTEGSVIPQATFDDYAKCFLSCLESATSGSDFTRDLVAVTDDVDAWELRLTLKIGVFTSKWTPTYKFLLKPVPLEPLDLLTAKVRDQEDEITGLKRQVALLEAQQEHDRKTKSAPLFVGGKFTNKVASGKLVWEADSLVLSGKIVFHLTGSIRFTTGGTFVVNAMIQNNNSNNSTTADLLLNGKVVSSCVDSNANGHNQVSSIYHVLTIAPEDEISVMYRGTNQAQPGSYIVIHELR